MKFGFRVPSLKRRLAARTSWKRVVRHSMGLKMPRGYGFLTSPKKALYNKIYRKTTFGIEDLTRSGSKKSSRNKSISSNAPQVYSPSSNNEPFVVSPRSFIQFINTPDKFGKDGWATIIIIFGILCLFGNPILGIILLSGGGYWMYRITKEPWYKAKKSLKKAKKLLKSNNFQEALQSLQEAINYDKENIELHYLVGVTLHANGKYSESIEHLKKYTDANPNDLDAKLVLAYSYYKIEKFKETITLLQQFSQDYFNYLLVILLLGDSFRELKEYDMAIDVFNRGPLRKRNLDSYLIQLHYLLGKAYKGKGDKQRALRHLRRAYSVDINYKDVGKEIAELEKK